MAGVLVDPAGRVLLAQRPAGKHLAGTWEFPGGKLESGETAEAGLARELSSYKIPHRIVVIPAAELPQLSSGKVDARQLPRLFDA